ncbi:hypothetical protein [Vibrio mediterranei]|uniref:hypothetical protein n=1 Tax=Vibrio mediterranei TaxID=689 RepID=UPI0040680E1B
MRGITIIEFAVVLIIGCLYIIFTYGTFSYSARDTAREYELREFLEKGFLSLRVKALEEIRANSNCLDIPTSNHTLSSLYSDYQLMDASYLGANATWFNGNAANFRLEADGGSGVLTKLQITLVRGPQDPQESTYHVHPFFVGSTDLGSGNVQMRYEKSFEIGRGYRTLYATRPTDASHCVVLG